MSEENKDLIYAGLKKNEWVTLIFYTKEWIKHLKSIDSDELSDDDNYIDAFNDTGRLEVMCDNIEEQLSKP